MNSCLFDGCTGLTDVKLNNNIVGESMFQSCTALTEIEIPDNITKIGSEAFNGCTGLKKVTLGRGLTTLGNKAFNNCNAIETVVSRSEIAPSMGGDGCFTTTVYNNATLYIPIGATEDYQLTDYWYKFANIVEKNLDVIPGDVDGDGELTISDVTTLIESILYGGGTGSADVDGDGEVTISDVVTLIELVVNSQ